MMGTADHFSLLVSVLILEVKEARIVESQDAFAWLDAVLVGYEEWNCSFWMFGQSMGLDEDERASIVRLVAGEVEDLCRNLTEDVL